LIDNDYGVWSAFDDHYRPAPYFVDADDIIRGNYCGEGRHEQTERFIQQLLGVEREFVSVKGLGGDAETEGHHLHTP
jgi:hypothetical protein